VKVDLLGWGEAIGAARIEELAGAAAGSLLTLLTPVFVAALAPLFLQERTRWRQWAGIAIALATVAAVAVTPCRVSDWQVPPSSTGNWPKVAGKLLQKGTIPT